VPKPFFSRIFSSFKSKSSWHLLSAKDYTCINSSGESRASCRSRRFGFSLEKKFG
jgi:hypothetical protein